ARPLKNSSPPHISKKKWPSCRSTLGEYWGKVLCRVCIEGLVKEHSTEQSSDLAASVKELSSTFESFKVLFENFQPMQPPASPLPVQQDVAPGPLAGPSASEGLPGGTREAFKDHPDIASSDDSRESDGEKVNGESTRTSRYKLSLEEVSKRRKNHCLSMIRCNKVLESRRGGSFWSMRSWLMPSKRNGETQKGSLSFLEHLKRRFPFAEDEAAVWNRSPRLDAAFSQVSRKTDLAFEDMGVLADPIDKRMDSLLKKTWDSSLGNLKPAMAVTVVVHNMEHWLTHIKAHIEAGTAKETILSSFPMLLKGVAYIADASAESVRMSAGSSALANSVNRALWLKNWQGDNALKIKLAEPLSWEDLLFGLDLEAVLDRTADKKKAFPLKKKLWQQSKKTRLQKKFNFPRGESQKKVWTKNGRGRGGAIFRPPEQP
ncbi:hypothetical protein AB205_0160780, partial [Aquarana catesbeiana]